MKSDRLVIAACILIAAGLALLFGFTKGTTGLTLGYPLSATRLHVDFTTTGIPVLLGFPLLAAGTLLLLFAFIAALFSASRRPVPVAEFDLEKRREPFAEFEELPARRFEESDE